MATAAYPMDSPSRLLKRVQQLEDMELPSLPSFQHDIDYDSASATEISYDEQTNRSSDSAQHLDTMATPHPLRNSHVPASVSAQSTSDNSSMSSISPYPPVDREASRTPSPYAPTAALTSTPQGFQQSRTRSTFSVDDTRSTMHRAPSHRRSVSGGTDLTGSTNTGREKWQTPGELSRSFSGDEIRLEDGLQGLQSDTQLLADQSASDGGLSSPERSAEQVAMTETPLTRRLSSSNIVLNRRRNVSSTAAFQVPLPIAEELEASSPISASAVHSPHPPSSSPGAVYPAANVARIPSLSTSERSVSDSSAAASTPEGPSRNPQIVTPRAGVPNASRKLEFNEMEGDAAESLAGTSHDSFSEAGELDGQDMLEPPSLGSMLHDSPAKPAPISQYSTPGVSRLRSQHNSSSEFAPTPKPAGTLRDVTSSHQDIQTPAVPFTPLPGGESSKLSDYSTPRAPLDDSERRKSHVLAVLSSTGLPTRTWRATTRGTPHPLRRVSTAPMTESISEDGTSTARDQTGISYNGSSSRIPDNPYEQQGNESFASVASSADLTSDRRATSHKARLSRGNTSFPTILLPTNASPANHASLRGSSEHRADGVKIHKHLNAMNKQLLDANADLAREAEAWREEVDRLRAILQNNGIDASLIDGFASNGLNDSARTDGSGQKAAGPSSSPTESSKTSGKPSGQQEGPALRNMAERLQALEIGMDEKDQVIAELQEALDDAREDQLDETGTAELQAQVDDLLQQVAQAEQERMTLQSDFAAKTEQHAKQFAEICEAFELQVKTLERSLEQAKDEARRLREGSGDQIVDQKHIAGEDRLAFLEQQLEAVQEQLRRREQEIDTLEREQREGHEEREQAETEIAALREQLEAAESAAADLEDIRAQLDEMNASRGNVSSEDEVRELQRLNAELEADLGDREEQLHELSERLRQLEIDLDTAERDDKEAEQDLRAEINRLNKTIESSYEEVARKEAELQVLRARMDDRPTRENGDADKEAVAEMEGHLEDAFREIGRLKQQLASTPHLQSSLELRETRIKSLEREKAALLERLKPMRESTPAGVQNAASPFKASPFVHKAIASLRMPKTPGSLQELSWLQTTAGDANEPILRAQLEHLQTELETANGQLDNNFSRLEAAGMNGVRLAEELAKAQNRIADLEDELRALAQRSKASSATAAALQTKRSDEARLKGSLVPVHKQLNALQSDFSAERSRLQKENERLSRVVSEIRSDHLMDLEAITTEAQRRSDRTEAELRRAKSEVVSVTRERDSAKRDLKSAEIRIKDFDRELSSRQKAYESLSRRQDGMAFQNGEMEEAQRKISKLEEALGQADSEARRLRLRAEDRQTALLAAESQVTAMKAERAAVAKELVAFERDLSDQQKDSQQFGVQLQLLKSEQQASAARHAADIGAAERSCRLAKDQLRTVEKQLEETRRAESDLRRWKESHHCVGNLNDALDQRRARFKIQSQELAVQIRYLKAKFTREATFRNALALQKRYLLLLVGGMSLNEQATLKQIASMGFPAPAPKPEKHTLRTVGIAILACIRARNAALHWKNERDVKLDAIAARDDRKRTFV